MKAQITLFFILATTLSFAQELDVNTDDNLAVHGYDVVSYFENKPVKGSKDFSFSHFGNTYHFANNANLKAFKTAPEKYLPQYGGYCAYAITRNKKMDVDPTTYELRDGKLYLFYNFWGTNTLEKWQKKPEKLQPKADKNWETLKFKE